LTSEDVFLCGCFDGSTGNDFGAFVADVACFRAGNIEKGDDEPLAGAACCIMGIPKALFTPGALRTAKNKKDKSKAFIGIKK